MTKQWVAAKVRNYRSIGRAMQRARQRSGFTLEGMAEASGRSASYCSQLENGYYAPSIDTMRAWAAACGVTLSELLEGAS